MTKDFLTDNISIEEFIIDYENYMDEHEEEISNYNRDIYEYLWDIKYDIGMYEPDPEIRDHPSYIDENELRRRTQANLEKVSNLI